MPPNPRTPTIAQSFAREARSGRELFRLPLHAVNLRRLPRGTGRPVLLLPGLGATDLSLNALARFLRRLGHDAQPLGLGRITARVSSTVPMVIERIREIGHGDTVALVGQSLGGVLAREAARRDALLVRRIITFGSPVFDRTGGWAAGSPGAVPITAIWSANDGVVPPEASIDRRHGAVENVEVTSSHLGMGFDPDVWRVVARRLALDGGAP